MLAYLEEVHIFNSFTVEECDNVRREELIMHFAWEQTVLRCP
jgi:hypothetical protein